MEISIILRLFCSNVMWDRSCLSGSRSNHESFISAFIINLAKELIASLMDSLDFNHR